MFTKAELRAIDGALDARILATFAPFTSFPGSPIRTMEEKFNATRQDLQDLQTKVQELAKGSD